MAWCFYFLHPNQLSSRHSKPGHSIIRYRARYRNPQNRAEDNGCPKNTLATKCSGLLLDKLKLSFLFKNSFFTCFQHLTSLNKLCDGWGHMTVGFKQEIFFSKFSGFAPEIDHMTTLNMHGAYYLSCHMYNFEYYCTLFQHKKSVDQYWTETISELYWLLC